MWDVDGGLSTEAGRRRSTWGDGSTIVVVLSFALTLGVTGEKIRIVIYPDRQRGSLPWTLNLMPHRHIYYIYFVSRVCKRIIFYSRCTLCMPLMQEGLTLVIFCIPVWSSSVFSRHVRYSYSSERRFLPP